VPVYIVFENRYPSSFGKPCTSAAATTPWTGLFRRREAHAGFFASMNSSDPDPATTANIVNPLR
jgi:hypothetical protein